MLLCYDETTTCINWMGLPPPPTCPHGRSPVSRSLRLLVLVMIAALSIGALLLARWQLERLDTRRAANQTLLEARNQPPLDLSLTGIDASTVVGRRVIARGSFDPSQQILLRGRVHRAAPGLHVVTAFRIDGTRSIIWVLRGFVSAPDGATPPVDVPSPTAGPVTVEGIAFALPVTDDGGQPLQHDRGLTYRRLDRGVLTARSSSMVDAYLMLAGDAGGPGGLPTVEPPTLDDGPHLYYAIQWFGIALAIAAFGVIVIRRDGRASPPPRAAP